MPNLPEDIWHLIVQHLARPELNKLISMNRALLNIVLDQKYRKVEWVALDDQIVRVLMRLQDPYIASRARCLHIRGWFIQYLFRRETLFKESRSSLFYEIKNQIAQLVGLPPSQPVVATSESIAIVNRLGVLSSSKNILRTMVNAIGLMVNVTEYKFGWGDLPYNQATQMLLAAPRRAFDTSLFKLDIHARVSQLEHILPSVDFPSLGELILHFDCDPSDADSPDTVNDGATNESILVGSVAPFINHTGASLCSLTISSLAQGDHTPFLNAIGPFPKLHLLCLRISFAPVNLSNASSIAQLLHAHRSTLNDVEVRPNPVEPPRGSSVLASLPPYQQPRDVSIASAWATVSEKSLVDPTWLADLESLTIPALDHATTLTFLCHMRSTLTQLCLLDQYLDTTEVGDVLALLGPRTQLQHLSIGIIRLTPELIRLLADTFPALYSLTLVLGVNPYKPVASDLILYRYPLQMDWALVDLSIFFKQVRENSVVLIPETRYENLLMFQLKDFVLTKLQSFRGRGHTQFEIV